MNATAKSRFSGAAPVFHVSHIGRALRFYVKQAGFEERFLWRDNENAPVSYAIVGKEECELHLALSPKRAPAALYVFTENIRDYYASVTGRGVIPSSEMQEFPWGMREFDITDPDGNILRFGEGI